MNSIVVSACLCAALILAGCQSKKEEIKEEISKYEVTSPLKMDTVAVKKYVAQIKAIHHIELRTQEKGYLAKIFVDEGQSVKAGQLLFRIMPNLYQAEKQKALAEVRFAEIEVQNNKTLVDKNVISKAELAMANAKLDKAKAELSLCDVHLRFTEIRAPYDGIIDRFQVRQGSLLSEGDLLTTLSDNSKMWVYFNVQESEYLDYKGKIEAHKPKVSLEMANHKIFDYPGVIETIEADFDNETGNIPFRATFPNSKGLLRHGETGNILMEVPLKDALLIPQKATFEVLDKKYVFVLDNENRVKSREITIGAELEDIYVVSKGLASSDKILLEGLRKVKENDKIAFDFKEPNEVMHHLKVAAE